MTVLSSTEGRKWVNPNGKRDGEEMKGVEEQESLGYII